MLEIINQGTSLKFEVGDRVYALPFGEGEVTAIKYKKLEVYFNDLDESWCFTPKGQFLNNPESPRSLFHYSEFQAGITIGPGQERVGRLIRMDEMRPLEVGIIEDPGLDAYNGHYVQRTASTFNTEVLSLSSPGIDRCWTGDFLPAKVRLLPPGESLTIKLFNND